MVELVDTLVSGTRARKGVQVQVLFRAKATQQWVAFFVLKSNVLAQCILTGLSLSSLDLY